MEGESAERREAELEGGTEAPSSWPCTGGKRAGGGEGLMAGL